MMRSRAWATAGTFGRLSVNTGEGIVGKRSILLLRWSVFVLACAFLYLRLAGYADPLAFREVLPALGNPVAVGTLAVSLVLMVVNWWLESIKWRILVSGVERVSRWRAFVATIAGTSIGVITPNRVGEFLGRVLFLAPEHRIAGSFATVVGSIAQFVVTVVMGTLGLLFFLLREWDLDDGPWQLLSAGGLSLAIATGAMSLMLYFNPDLLRALVGRLPVVHRWARHAEVLASFSRRDLLRVLLLGMSRYLVFTLQFAILLSVLAAVPVGDSLPMIPLVYLLSTLVPTVMLTELGVRGSVAVALIPAESELVPAVLLSSTALWTINVGLPALAGAFILLTARLRAARNA